MKPTRLILLSALVACGGSSSKERPTEATFKVEVNPTDAKGGKWDRLGGDSSAPPDIGICVIARTGKACYPDENLLRSQCPDSFSCTFTGIPIPPEEFTVQVVDVDAINNEEVGQDTCDWDDTCTIGESKVSIE